MSKNQDGFPRLTNTSIEDLLHWFEDAFNNFPELRKRVLAKIKGKSWHDVEQEILGAVSDQNYTALQEFNDLLDTDLIDFAIEGRPLGIDDTLQSVRGDSRPVDMWRTTNLISKSPKLEAYVLYRRMMGRPRFILGKTGFIRKKDVTF